VAAEGLVVALPGAEITLAAERAGRLVRVRVHEGERVRRGQLLAEIEASELRAGLARFEARRAESQAEQRLAELTRDRLRHLVELDISSPNELDEAERNLDIARARSDLARAEIALQLAQIRAATVVAPFPGTVTARHTEAGETVTVGQPVVTLADLSRLRVEAEADEADAEALRVGATVLIAADGYAERTWRGRVLEVGEAVTPRRLRTQDPRRPSDTRVIPVKVVPVERLPLKLGTTVQIEIEAPREEPLSEAPPP
jgi:RND family efflux transporter MFP subunit